MNRIIAVAALATLGLALTCADAQAFGRKKSSGGCCGSSFGGYSGGYSSGCCGSGGGYAYGGEYGGSSGGCCGSGMTGGYAYGTVGQPAYAGAAGQQQMYASGVAGQQQMYSYGPNGQVVVMYGPNGQPMYGAGQGSPVPMPMAGSGSGNIPSTGTGSVAGTTPGNTPAPGATTGGTAARNTGKITVMLPHSNTEVWFEDTPLPQTGKERTFNTPPLSDNKTHNYTVKARWLDGDKPVEKSLPVSVKAGETATVDFR